MITWPEALYKDLARRRCVIYLGSGVSKNSQNEQGEHPKTWKEFLLFLADCKEMSKEQKSLLCSKIECGDYLLVCELAHDFLGEERYNNILRQEFQQKRFEHSDIHESIQQLDSRLVVSANFDQIYENYARQVTKGAVTVKNYYDDDLASYIRNSDDLILKLHGTIDTPNKMVFTQSQYAEARNHNPGFYQILSALITTHTFLFLGAGLNDPDIRLLLENYAFQYQWSRKHFFVIPNDQLSKSEMKVFERSLNLEFILYNSENNHQELKDSLKELNALVDAYREELSKTQQW